MKIYIASPFFNDEEVRRVKEMEKFLENRGYDVYSPMRDGIMLTPDATQEDRLQVFNENVENVFDCDLMMVIVATKDTGTSVELGMKYAQWKCRQLKFEQLKNDDPEILTRHDYQLMSQETPRIITFADNGTEVNVMLLGAVLKHCKSWDELSEYLDYVDETGLDFAKRDYKSITDVDVF